VGWKCLARRLFTPGSHSHTRPETAFRFEAGPARVMVHRTSDASCVHNKCESVILAATSLKHRRNPPPPNEDGQMAALANGTIVAFCSASISRWIVLCVDQDDVSFISLVVYCEYPPYPLGTSSAHPSGLWCQLTKSYLALRRFTMKHAPHGEVARDPHLVRGSKLEGEDDGIEWRGSSRVSRRRCRR
jgi:hypothetical protein